MNKIIKQEQFNAIMSLLTKYNVGVQEYQALMQLWDKAEEIKENEKTENKKAE